ncbi:Sodium/calcium exchanger protein-domain-containing protein [Dimargaris cristalligena]|uniref:Sodium/calcium exchanger protein-domain-containing protein n=1 Tax=Dimargaris cristalligena TaxID=215637 RepID=A0A4Q0A0B1_9FUNG|nr:Sodium/calcium exchanger protein-domain-containing protein [Dimargaris cristalligena]|eukprot:RKP39465.1 Sodium/calcium exchanger protein-domain-containing protein [Dimargaris cristalligena]
MSDSSVGQGTNYDQRSTRSAGDAPPVPRSRNSRANLQSPVRDSNHREGNGDNEDDDEEDADSILDDPDATLKERQEAMNISHPFGLPLWKPALYKKSRSITRFANRALHVVPKSSSDLFLQPGNILWVLVFGWWLSVVVAVAGVVLYCVPTDGHRFGRVLMGLSYYLLWPFGRPVERVNPMGWTAPPPADPATITTTNTDLEAALDMYDGDDDDYDNDNNDQETRPLLSSVDDLGRPAASVRRNTTSSERLPASAGKFAFYTVYFLLIAPLLLIVSGICWFCVVTIPMARLSYKLAKYLRRAPLQLRFRRETPPPSTTAPTAAGDTCTLDHVHSHAPLPASSSGKPANTILLCVHEATGFQYYKYTIDGVNIIFINLLFVVVFVLVDAHFIGPWTNHSTFLSNEGLIFNLSLLSTIPLSYFIGQAVSSISAQSSLGLGAVINATFGSIIEVILSMMAIIQGKSVLIEGALIGSFLAGLLLMPGMSMVAGGLKQKEQRFNVRSTGVSSTLLIMSIIGAFAPTLFYQVYGTYELSCTSCPSSAAVFGSDIDDGFKPPKGGHSQMPWQCSGCSYRQGHPVHDPFFHSHAKPFMYFCAAILPTAYLVGLWFTLRTHVKHIYSQPHPEGSRESRFLNRALNLHILQQLFTSHRGSKDNLHQIPEGAEGSGPVATTSHYSPSLGGGPSHHDRGSFHQSISPAMLPHSSPAILPKSPETFIPLDNHDTMNTMAEPGTDEHQSPHIYPHNAATDDEGDGGGHGGGGHDSPNWSKTKSAAVLVGCTLLFSAIAEILVDCADSVIEALHIDQKFLGLTLFALAPNVPEITNAIAFAYQKNISLALEICSAYTVQVSLLQIPVLVLFSALWNGGPAIPNVGNLFTLIFPPWDLIAVLFSIYLITYTYIEGKSNYFKGAILVLSYSVWLFSFFFEPDTAANYHL